MSCFELEETRVNFAHSPLAKTMNKVPTYVSVGTPGMFGKDRLLSHINGDGVRNAPRAHGGHPLHQTLQWAGVHHLAPGVSPPVASNEIHL